MAFSRNWLEPSDEAKLAGVCHTGDECQQMYEEIDAEKKARAIQFLRDDPGFQEDIPKIREAMELAEEGESWVAGYHFGWGMSIRNLLRRAGMGEPYFGIDNLDCIYTLLVEDALQEETS